MSKPEYTDVFLKAERFIFVCGECFSAVIPGYQGLHTDWHEKNDEGED